MSYFQVTEEDRNAFRTKLKDALGEGYEVEINKEVSALMGAIKETFDYVIFHNGDAIAGIEYKYNIAVPFMIERFEDLYIDKFRKVGLKYGIEYYGDRNGLQVWTKGSSKFEGFSFENFIIAIKGNKTCGAILKDDIIQSEITKCLEENKTGICKDQAYRIVELFSKDNIEYDEKKASISLKQDAEDEMFKILLQQEGKRDDILHVCRYSSLNSLFWVMRDRCHAMCSITCMNDKGELSYADKYVGYGAYSVSTQMTKDNNNCFILSCCKKDMVDNLTMWRLYGNEGKGVCIEYDVDVDKIDNKEFFYGLVSYGNKKNYHPRLNFIRELKHWKNNGWGFELKRWYIWKHFFKSYLFKDEEEVRLLYVWTEKSKDKVEWIMDATNNIASRICKFSITENKFPLTLTNAIIGPKCPELGSNVDQFNYMNRQMWIMPDNWLRPAVKASGIEDYR